MNIFYGMDEFLGLKIIRLEDELSKLPDVKKWMTNEGVFYKDTIRKKHKSGTKIGTLMASDYAKREALISEILELRNDWRENHYGIEFDRKLFNYQVRKPSRTLESKFGSFDKFVEKPNDFENANVIWCNGREYDSKSEMTISEIYEALHIQCKFHVPIVLSNGERVVIDAVPYIEELGTYFFHEHFGKLGDPDYVRRNANKHRWYMESGLVLQRDILCTYENRQSPADYKYLKENIKAFILSNL